MAALPRRLGCTVTHAPASDPLARFSEPTRSWFGEAFAEPTQAPCFHPGEVRDLVEAEDSVLEIHLHGPVTLQGDLLIARSARTANEPTCPSVHEIWRAEGIERTSRNLMRLPGLATVVCDIRNHAIWPR